jgi:predicted TIM-barrel fold metal-dependent hydrolase
MLRKDAEKKGVHYKMPEILCSADAHVQEPPDLYVTRLPKELRDRAFRIENHGDFEDNHFPTQQESFTANRFVDIDGNYVQPSLEQRLKNLKDDGIWAEIMFPNHFFQHVADHELAIAHCQVYNDYVAETFRAVADRHRAIAMVPVTDIGDAVAEIERAATLGLRGVNLPTFPPGAPYSDPRYNPVWAAVAANNLVLTFHIGTGFEADENGKPLKTGFENLLNEFYPVGDPHAHRFRSEAAQPAKGQPVLMDLVGSGVLERHPDLHVVFAEFNAYWLASVMACMDKAYRVGIGQWADWRVGIYDKSQPPDNQSMMIKPFGRNVTWPYPLRPSEYIKRQVHVTFMDDPVAVACRHVTGVDSLLWSNDYPHAEGTWPRSREAVDKLFAGVEPAERAAILGGNLARVFDLRMPEPSELDSMLTNAGVAKS